MATDIGKVDFSSAMSISGLKNLSDGQFANFLGGSYGELIVAELFGKYGELSRRGYVFTGRSAAATIPIYTTLTNAPVLWNPAGSGKLVIPLKLTLTPAGLGTPVIGGLTACFLTNTGATYGTAAPVPTFTPITPLCMNPGAGGTSTCLFAAAAVTYTVQPTPAYDIGLGMWKSGTDAISTPITLVHDFDGAVMLKQGTLMAIGNNPAASVTTYVTQIMWAEIPMTVT